MTRSLLAKIYRYTCIYSYTCACLYLHIFLCIHLYVPLYAKVCHTVLVLMLMLITYLLFCIFYIDKSTYFCRSKDIWTSLCFRTFIQEINIVIQILISRKWEFCGPSGNNPLQHIDMVLFDEQVSINIHSTSAVFSL
jgi:hypothetical protein